MNTTSTISTATSSNGASADTLPFDGYIRISRVNGRSGSSFRSPGDQRQTIEELAARHGLKLGEIIEERDVSGGKAIADRELNRLVDKVKRGESGGIIVWNVKRYSRHETDGLRTALDIYEAGGELIAEGFERVDPAMRLVWLTLQLGEAQRELAEKRKTWKRAGDAELARGVHAGSTAPLGYDWSEDDGRRGPLVVTADSARVVAGFTAYAEGASWSQTVKAFGAKSQGAARNMLRNRVYIGEARSFAGSRPDSHPAIIDPALWSRVQLRLAAGERGTVTTEKRARRGTPKLGGVLRCEGCGRTLQYDGGNTYRCKNITADHVRPSVAAEQAEAFMLELALEWHAESYRNVVLAAAVEDAVLPALEDELTKALAELDAAEAAMGCTLPEDSKPRVAVANARRALDNAQAAQGWHGLDPEAVKARLDGADTLTVNSFIRELVSATVTSSGRNAPRQAIADRLTVTKLAAGKTTAERTEGLTLREAATSDWSSVAAIVR